MAKRVAKRVNFTAPRIVRFRCPDGKPQAFLWDSKAPGLGLRVTANGARAYVFQGRLLKTDATLRMTIGSPDSWTIPAAQAEARRLQGLIDQGKDPRIEEAATIAARQAEIEAADVERQRHEVSGLDAWTAYVADRLPQWGELSRRDHAIVVAEGGVPHKRAAGVLTKPGILRALLALPLAEVDAPAVEKWAKRETAQRPVLTARAFRMLRAFVNWCAEHPEYRRIVNADACNERRVREKLAKPAAKDDALQREQLAAWFAEVRKLPPAMAGYLQVLLLTGCRPGEALDMRWTDVDFKWRSLRIRDKVEGERTIPLPPYLAAVLRELKGRNDRRPEPPRRIKADPQAAATFARSWRASPWVFVSNVKTGTRAKDASHAHRRALAAAGLPHVTLHGLRRSFGTLAEWVECPVGIVAQIQGHKPSAIAEKHYRVRPLDLLRMWHDRIEGWILSEAGIEQPKAEEAGKPALVAVEGGRA